MWKGWEWESHWLNLIIYTDLSEELEVHWSQWWLPASGALFYDCLIRKIHPCFRCIRVQTCGMEENALSLWVNHEFMILGLHDRWLQFLKKERRKDNWLFCISTFLLLWLLSTVWSSWLIVLTCLCFSMMPICVLVIQLMKRKHMLVSKKKKEICIWDSLF